jgi:hypothetical protein
MSITNKAISTTFFNIIIRTYHGQTENVIQYGCLRSSVMCVNTSCSNDRFASPTHTTKQSLVKALCDVDIRILIAPLVFSNSSLITSFIMAIHDVTWLVFVKTFWTRITPVFFFGRHYHRISQQLHSDIRSVNLVINPVINREWVKYREVFTTSGTYPWSFVTQIFHNGQPSHGGDRKISKWILKHNHKEPLVQ